MSTLTRLRLDPHFMPNVTAWEELPARPARYAPFPAALHPLLISNLQSLNLSQFYSHQAQAIDAALRGENVVVVTGTASGKTLCYNAPVLHTLLTDPTARALYLFPTKALAQDQASALNLLISQSPNLPIPINVYDGDTPTAHRPAIRKASGILLSNPDMLHTGLLPHHTQWAEWLGNLRFVVLDELHVYRGAFGSHMANVLRRLKRLCAFYGAAPQFICTSATIANPQALAEKLIEAPVTLVDDDGAPHAAKTIVVYNPPLLNSALGQRRSYLLETQRLAREFLADDVQTAIFARTRHATEVLLTYVREDQQRRGHDPQHIRGYRGGYLPLERRAIEHGLRDGSVRGVVATNALELGVDIGQLGAVLMAGYPGTIASLWQQAGRAGRRAQAEASAAVLIASAAPLDQYLAAHPRYLFERSPEHALINPDNLAVLSQHVRCAAFELPFAPGEKFGALAVEALLRVLAEDGEVHETRGTYRWVGTEYPAASVSLRSATTDTVLIQDASAGRPVVIGEVDRATAPVRVHEGAVYLHEGRVYRVTQLDWEQGLAIVQPAEVDYFTEASEAVDVTVVAVRETTEDDKPMTEEPATVHRPPSTTACAWGDLLITAQALSYRQVKRYTHETLGYGVINLPARDFNTTGFWLWIPPAREAQLAQAGVLVGPNHYGPTWEQQRLAARTRDGFRCQQCGTPESPSPEAGRGARGEGGRQHDVHHLQPFRSFGYVPGLNHNDEPANTLDNLQTLCRACHQRVEASRGTQTALGGLAYALGNLAPLFLMCDPRDIGVLSENRAKATRALGARAPTITLYDQTPEGMGLAEQLFTLRAELLRGALELVSACPCREGCPACVGPVGVEGLETKELTRRLAEALITQALA